MFSVDEFRKLAGERTKGKWCVKSFDDDKCYIETDEDYVIPYPDKDSYPCRIRACDAKFIVYAANNADAIIAEMEFDKNLHIAHKTERDLLHHKIEDLEELVAVYKNLCDLDENKRLHKRIEKLEKALEYYAETYIHDGETAREALEDVESSTDNSNGIEERGE